MRTGAKGRGIVYTSSSPEAKSEPGTPANRERDPTYIQRPREIFTEEQRKIITTNNTSVQERIRLAYRVG